MSREILFRGKDKYSERWYEGFLIKVECVDNKKLPKKTVIFPVNAECNWFNDFIFGKKEVMPETVGQFTGLTDKNGKKIFEGDIVKWNEKEWGRPYNELVEFDYELLTMREHDYEQWCEVVGNIHDNPELLGEEK